MSFLLSPTGSYGWWVVMSVSVMSVSVIVILAIFSASVAKDASSPRKVSGQFETTRSFDLMSSSCRFTFLVFAKTLGLHVSSSLGGSRASEQPSFLSWLFGSWLFGYSPPAHQVVRITGALGEPQFVPAHTLFDDPGHPQVQHNAVYVINLDTPRPSALHAIAVARSTSSYLPTTCCTESCLRQPET